MAQAIREQPTVTVKNIPTYLWLTIPVAIGTFIAALAGVLNPSIYENSDSLAAQGQAQDLVTLVLALPTLIVSAFYLVRGKVGGRVIWLGALIYIAYTYAIAAFQVSFNQLFLLYVVILSTSFYAALLGFMDAYEQEINLKENAPVRLISSIAVLIALMYYALWLRDIVPATLNNTIPAAVTQDNIPTSAVHVLDLGFYLPLLIAGAVMLWQRKQMGVVITGATLAFAPLMGVAVAAMVVNLVNWELADGYTPVVIFGVTTLLTGGLLVWLLRQVE